MKKKYLEPVISIYELKNGDLLCDGSLDGEEDGRDDPFTPIGNF